MIAIKPLAAVAASAIETLLDDRFGTARHHRTAYRLRDGAGVLADASFAALAEDRLVGSVQCWPIRLRHAAGMRQLVLLGPVAVAADRERQGIGSALVRASLAALDSASSAPVLLIGDAPYYGRFGFTAAATHHWELPGPVDRARLLLRVPTTGLSARLPRIGRVEAASDTMAGAATVA